jgi:divinyl protochlorophyllide a 8-vinyl-reductase
MAISGIRNTVHISHETEVVARIGPNSLIQTVQALEEIYGKAGCFEVLLRGKQFQLLKELPSEMVDEQQFMVLAQMLFSQLGVTAATKVLKRSGQLTGDYLLANRIPKPVQILFKFMPPFLRLRLLLSAIGKNAWTFAGSGTYSFILGKAPVIVLKNCITAKLAPNATEPVCSYYTGTFERLLQALVSPAITVQEQECLAIGYEQCTFSIRL